MIDRDSVSTDSAMNIIRLSVRVAEMSSSILSTPVFYYAMSYKEFY